MLMTTEYRNIMETLESFAKNFQEIRKRLDDLECDKQPTIVKREAWVNIYTAEECFAYPTKEKADSWASDNRKACIRIEWEEEE